MSISIVCTNITKYYSSSGLYALKDLNCTIDAGSKNLFIGKPGSGISTLFQILSQNLLPDSGEILYNGKKFSQLKKLCKPYCLFYDGSAILPYWLTVREYLSFCAQLSGKTKYESAATLNSITCDSAVHILLDRRISSIGTEDRKKVELHSLLVSNPDLLIYETDLSGCTAKFQHDFIHVLFSADHACTVIVSFKGLHRSCLDFLAHTSCRIHEFDPVSVQMSKGVQL